MGVGDVIQGFGVAAVFHGDAVTATMPANLAIAKLEAFGVPAMHGPNAPSAAWGVGGAQWVLVPPDRLREALEVLQRHNGGSAPDDEATEPPARRDDAGRSG